MTPSLPTGPHTFQSAGEGPEQADRALPPGASPAPGKREVWGSSANVAPLRVTAEGPGGRLAATARCRHLLCTPGTEFPDFPF